MLLPLSAAEFATRYAGLGWKIVLLHGCTSPNLCTCKKGRGCPSPGKHPRHNDWKATATSDEETIYGWNEKFPDANYGLLLGPASGVIDVEYDGKEGEEKAKELGLDQLVTPTYDSARSVHRLFAWTAELPDVQKATPFGLEIRIGGGGKSTQSVLPPSLHPSGKRYAWRDGLSPLEVDLLPCPESIIALAHNDDPDKSGERKTSRGRELILKSVVVEGERTTLLYSFACRYIGGKNMTDEREQGDLFDILSVMNLQKCKPPLPESKVRQVQQEAIQFAYEKASDPGASQIASLVRHGLVHLGSGAGWGPGEWSTVVVDSDPPLYRTNVPRWKELTPDQSGDILTTIEQFRSAKKFAAVVQTITKAICLDDQPGYFEVIWDGKAASKAGRGWRGVKAQLINNCVHVAAPAVAKRHVVVAEYLQEQLERATDANETDEPDSRGMPAYRRDGSLWFGWRRVWQDLLMTGQVKQEEVDEVRRRLGLHSDKDFRQWPARAAAGVRRLRYCVMRKEHFEKLTQLIEGVKSESE